MAFVDLLLKKLHLVKMFVQLMCVYINLTVSVLLYVKANLLPIVMILI